MFFHQQLLKYCLEPTAMVGQRNYHFPHDFSRVWFVDSTAGGVAETMNGVPCLRFNVPQTDGWTATIWFAQTADGQGNVSRFSSTIF